MSRDVLHELVDRIPEDELPAAQRFLEYLAVTPACRTAFAASPDDEPVTAGDALLLYNKAREDVRAGKVISHDEIVRDLHAPSASTHAYPSSQVARTPAYREFGLR